MKKVYLLTLVFVLSLSLNARENPFATYEEETGRMYEVNENPKTIDEIQEAQYIKKIQAQMNEQIEPVQKKPAIVSKPIEKTYSKKELDEIVQKANKQNEQKTKEIVKKELANVKKEPEQLIYVKPRVDVVSSKDSSSLVANGTKKLLPFLDIELSDDKLVIKSEHKVFKKFSIDKENKLVFDYRAKVSFNTIRDILASKNFKNIAIGNHQKSGYFRVAVELEKKPSNYIVDVSNENVSISLK